MKRVVILGGGSGGAVAAKRLARWSREGEVEVVLVDRSPFHEYRPSYLWVMTGKREPDDVRRPLGILAERYGTRVVQASVTGIDPAAKRVSTDGEDFDYDFLIVALGAEMAPRADLTGLDAPWELDGAIAAGEHLADFNGGRVAVGVEAWPYRCPPAPFEAAMMMRYLAEQRGVSKRTEISVFHTWQGPMETFGPLMVDGFGRLLDQRQVRFEGGFELASHDASNRTLRAADGRELGYDLGIVVPAHRAPSVIADSGLVADGGYMDVELPSMRAPAHEDVWGIGDVVAPTIGLGMAGVFAHFQAEHVVTQILDRVRGAFVGELHNMVGLCVMDTGYEGAAVWCDFTSKLEGRTTAPDCRMLGGMRAFRAIKSGFERYWFANLFGG
ncbi:MAG: NAD(P)/FAD-dependent oxidoreductase [Solirubrobacterales bacterium]